MKIKALLFLLLLGALIGSGATFAVLQGGESDDVVSGYVVPEGAVPDLTTAVNVARSVLLPIYGNSMIRGVDYFSAEIHDDIWTVTCFLPEENDAGKVLVDVAKADGRISRIATEK